MQTGQDIRVYTALHTVQVRTYIVEVCMGPIVKKEHTDFCGVSTDLHGM